MNNTSNNSTSFLGMESDATSQGNNQAQQQRELLGMLSQLQQQQAQGSFQQLQQQFGSGAQNAPSWYPGQQQLQEQQPALTTDIPSPPSEDSSKSSGMEPRPFKEGHTLSAPPGPTMSGDGGAAAAGSGLSSSEMSSLRGSVSSMGSLAMDQQRFSIVEGTSRTTGLSPQAHQQQFQFSPAQVASAPSRMPSSSGNNTDSSSSFSFPLGDQGGSFFMSNAQPQQQQQQNAFARGGSSTTGSATTHTVTSGTTYLQGTQSPPAGVFSSPEHGSMNIPGVTASSGTVSSGGAVDRPSFQHQPSSSTYAVSSTSSEAGGLEMSVAAQPSNPGSVQNPSVASAAGPKLPPRGGKRQKRSYRHESFPEKLYRMLMELEQQGRDDVISFVRQGTAFQIHQPAVFEDEIMRNCFRQSKLASFKRQLSMYGFQRMSGGPDHGSYRNPNFRRGNPELCRDMERSNSGES